MDLNEYQLRANKTDQVPKSENVTSMMIPLLGLAGRSGALLTEYLRFFRDGDSYKIFKERIAEDLGDILWYVSNIAEKEGLALTDVAQGNLEKIRDRWHDQESEKSGRKGFDEDFPAEERFPTTFEVRVSMETDAAARKVIRLQYEGRSLGNDLTDNSSEEDGYRYHDVFHLSFLVYLDWSPVMRGRQFFNCKRKSLPVTDEVQDGGRAAVIDEAIVALIFTEAKKNSFYEGVNTVSFQTLRLIKELTSHLEVARCSAKQWEQAILNGFRVWRSIREHGNGLLRGDRSLQRFDFYPCSLSGDQR